MYTFFSTKLSQVSSSFWYVYDSLKAEALWAAPQLIIDLKSILFFLPTISKCMIFVSAIRGPSIAHTVYQLARCGSFNVLSINGIYDTSLWPIYKISLDLFQLLVHKSYLQNILPIHFLYIFNAWKDKVSIRYFCWIQVKNPFKYQGKIYQLGNLWS